MKLSFQESDIRKGTQAKMEEEGGEVRMKMKGQELI